jgi:hypothetical protein
MAGEELGASLEELATSLVDVKSAVRGTVHRRIITAY